MKDLRMIKVKTFKLLPIMIALSGSVVAETASLSRPVSGSQAEVGSIAQDTILPQLSFAAQQARAAELMKQADYALQQEQIRQELARKFVEAETRIQQEIGGNVLLLSQNTTKIYLDNQFTVMWGAIS